MPRKNSRKVYVENGFYHLYNRGVEKREIFLDEQDYKTFLYFLKKYLDPESREYPYFKNDDLTNQIQLLVYCLMPNHFHFLVKQKVINGITKFMSRIMTNYVMYFNKKYKRVGPLFQGVYKAVLIDNDNQFLHLSRYIHLNPYPEIITNIKDLSKYSFSSYGEYLGKRRTKWVNTEEILSFFAQNKNKPGYQFNNYQSFVEDFVGEFNLSGLIIEDDELLNL